MKPPDSRSAKKSVFKFPKLIDIRARMPAGNLISGLLCKY
jgi:hypothetical protein